MESPGEYLKREREHRGVSLDDIFKATRVPLKHLEALEADNYDDMPHATFIKGYIKSYCKVLGVDETDAVLRYEIYLKDKACSADNAKAVPRPRKIQRQPLLGHLWGDRRNIIMVAVGVPAVVIIIIAFLIFGAKAPGPVEVEEQVAQEAQEAVIYAEPADATGKPVSEAAPAPVKAVEKAPEPVKAVEEAPMRHSLAVKAIETVWIQAVIDKGKPFDVTLKQGDTVVWKAAESLTLKIGNAGGVSLTFNGKQMPPVGEAGYVVSLDLPGGKVKVLAAPEPEEEPVEPAEKGLEAGSPAPAATPGADIKEPELAPGVDIRELLPAIAPVEGVKSFKPAATMVEGIKSPVKEGDNTEAEGEADLPPAP